MNRRYLICFSYIFLLLNFQIDKYIKVADSGTIPENDPMHFKPNLDALDQVQLNEKSEVNQFHSFTGNLLSSLVLQHLLVAAVSCSPVPYRLGGVRLGSGTTG